MKTIEQRAGEYAHETEEKNGFDMHPKTASFQGYYQGFSECQKECEEKFRWIPISEKYPDSLSDKPYSDYVIVKDSYGDMYIARYDIFSQDWDIFIDKVTHWRSIHFL